MITSRGQTRQVLLSEPNVSFFPLTPAQSVILPAHARSLSFYCLHIHYSLSLSLKVSLCHQHADVLSLVFVSYATDSFESLEIFSNPRQAVQRRICQGHMQPSSVTISLRGRQARHRKHLFGDGLQKSHGARNGTRVK